MSDIEKKDDSLKPDTEKDTAASEPAGAEAEAATTAQTESDAELSADTAIHTAAAESTAAEESSAEEQVIWNDLDTGNTVPDKAGRKKAKKKKAKKDKKSDVTEIDISPSTDISKPRKKKKKFPFAAVIAAVSSLFVCGAAWMLITWGLNGDVVPTGADVSSKASEANSGSDTSEGSMSIVDGSDDGTNEISQVDYEALEISRLDTTDITFSDNVTIEGVSMKGMTLSQANKALQEKVLELRDRVTINIACDGKTFVLTEDDFVYDSNLADVLIQAYHYGRGEMQNPTIEYQDIDGKSDFKITTTLNRASIDAAVKKVAKNFDVQPINAHVTSFDPTATEKFKYEDGSNGWLTDQSEIRKGVVAILEQTDKSGSFTIETTETPFTVSMALIKANTKLIASHSTACNNSAASVANMQLAIKAANGTIINPGETFSFNTMTGDTTNGNTHYYDNGTVGSYVPSTAYSHGEVVQDFGGGICQASTTIFLCALKTDMEVVERHAHMYASSYAAYGLDATVDYGNLDMRFKNTYQYPVYIATYVYGGRIMVEMYGPISTDYDEIVPVGWVTYADSKIFSARGAKVYFKNGKETKRVLLPAGTYDYHYESWSSVSNYIPNDTENGPSVSPDNYVPTVYSPSGCGSSAPIPYGTASEVIKKALAAPSESSKPQESSKKPAANSSKPAEDSSKPAESQASAAN